MLISTKSNYIIFMLIWNYTLRKKKNCQGQRETEKLCIFLTCPVIAAYKIRIRQVANSNLMHSQVNERLGSGIMTFLNDNILLSCFSTKTQKELPNLVEAQCVSINIVICFFQWSTSLSICKPWLINGGLLDFQNLVKSPLVDNKGKWINFHRNLSNMITFVSRNMRLLGT